LHLIAVTVDGKLVPKSGDTGCNATCPGSVDLVMGEQHLVTRICHTPADCTGYTGSILGGDPIPFDGCCMRDDAPGAFCATKDPTFMMIAKYSCQP
jgi:hypothetical protein